MIPGRQVAPSIDSSRHLHLAELYAGFTRLGRPPAETGVLSLIVRRLEGGTRDTPTRARLTTAEGLVGDAWNLHPPRDPNAQVTVMRQDVARLIANGQPLTLFGDNFFVDLDISAGNLPAGTRLRVGESVVEVTPEPHNGCRRFKERFGHDALRFTAQKELRSERLRGIHWRVIEPGNVSVGDEVEVLAGAPG